MLTCVLGMGSNGLTSLYHKHPGAVLCDIWLWQEVVEVVVYVKEHDSAFNLYQLYSLFLEMKGLTVGIGGSPLPVMGLGDTVI